MLAERVAARRATEKANEADLAELLRLIADLEANDIARDRRIDVARVAYDSLVTKVRNEFEALSSKIRDDQSNCVRRLRDRGESPSAIAAMTGLSAIEVGRLARGAVPASPASGADDPGLSTNANPTGSDCDLELPSKNLPAPSRESQ